MITKYLVVTIKIGEAHKDKIVTQQTRDRLSKANKGRISPNKGKVWGDDYKKKVSEGVKRFCQNIQLHPNSKSVKQYTLNKELIKEWNSTKEAAIHFNKPTRQLLDHLMEKTKTFASFKWTR